MTASHVLSIRAPDLCLEADIAIRVTNSPPETLIGKKIGKVASTVYGSQTYLERMRARHETPRWIGVNCCDYHQHWTKELSGDETFNFYVDEPIITHETVRQGLGLAILPCHMGDRDPALVRYTEPPAEMVWTSGCCSTPILSAPSVCACFAISSRPNLKKQETCWKAKLHLNNCIQSKNSRLNLLQQIKGL